jgi:hypothetical protein
LSKRNVHSRMLHNNKSMRQPRCLKTDEGTSKETFVSHKGNGA